MGKELLYVFSLCLGAFLALLLVGRLLKLRELFLSQDVSVWDLGQLFFYLSPFFVLLLMPIASMLSVFLTFLRMSTDRELVALRAGGLSLWQMLPVTLFFLLLCSAANMAVGVFGVSWGMDNFRATILDMAKTRTQLVLQPGVFNRDFPGLTIFARQVERSTGELTTVFVEDTSQSQGTIAIAAPQGHLTTDTEKGEVVFSLQNGRLYRHNEDSASVLGFGEYRIALDLQKIISGVELEDKRPKEMAWNRLWEYHRQPDLAQTRDATFDRKVDLELHKRIALPLACLALGLFALPLAVLFEGLKRHLGFLVSLGLFLVYYTLFSIGKSLGETGDLPPAVGMWAPNILFLCLGGVLFQLAAQERGGKFVERLIHALRGRRLWRKRNTA
ncbi:MAG: LPS export ABC transporter permease LptF [Desulfohalobium sp.]